ESVQAGLVLGTASMVDGVVERIAKELGQPTVFATGGLAELVIAQCASVDHHEPWLTLEGLRLIFERNAQPDEGGTPRQNGRGSARPPGRGAVGATGEAATAPGQGGRTLRPAVGHRPLAGGGPGALR